MDELEFYADEPLLIKKLYINDFRVPRLIRYLIRIGDMYVIRKTNDSPARYTFFNSTGGMWTWRDNETDLVEMI